MSLLLKTGKLVQEAARVYLLQQNYAFHWRINYVLRCMLLDQHSLGIQRSGQDQLKFLLRLYINVHNHSLLADSSVLHALQVQWASEGIREKLSGSCVCKPCREHQWPPSPSLLVSFIREENCDCIRDYVWAVFTGVAALFRQLQHHFYDDSNWLYQALHRKNRKHSRIGKRVHVLADLLPLDLLDRLCPKHFWPISDGLVSDLPNSHQRYDKLRLRLGQRLHDSPPQDQAILP